MAITSIGYERAITYAQLGVLLAHAGASYSVFGTDDFAVSAGVGDRALSVQPGQAYGMGILDTSDELVTLTGASVASGSRWDLVALRRNWTAGGVGATTPVLIQGGPTKVLPARSVTQGVEDDHPIALVRFAAGQAAVQEVEDLRVWHGDGGCFARSRMVRDFLTRIGTHLYINDRTYVRRINSSGSPEWATDTVIFSSTQPSPVDVPWLKVP